MEEPKKLTFAEEMALLKKDKASATRAGPRPAPPTAPPGNAPTVLNHSEASRHMRPKTVELGTFARELKRQSLYPTFRSIVALSFIISCLAGVLFIIAGVYAFKGDSLFTGLGLIFAGFFAIIMGKVLQELSLMLADAADAAVYIAAHTKKE